MYKVTAIKYGQQAYEKTEDQVDDGEWKMTIVEMKPNGVVITHGIIQVRSEITRNE